MDDEGGAYGGTIPVITRSCYPFYCNSVSSGCCTSAVFPGCLCVPGRLRQAGRVTRSRNQGQVFWTGDQQVYGGASQRLPGGTIEYIGTDDYTIAGVESRLNVWVRQMYVKATFNFPGNFFFQVFFNKTNATFYFTDS